MCAVSRWLRAERERLSSVHAVHSRYVVVNTRLALYVVVNTKLTLFSFVFFFFLKLFLPLLSVPPLSLSLSSLSGTWAGENSLECSGCVAGLYRGRDQDAGLPCTNCPVGWHQPQAESAACMPCIPGKYASSEATAGQGCGICSVDFYSPNPGEESCKECELGFYTNKKQSSAACTDCPAGTAGKGCQPCGFGKYRGTTDPTTMCIDCVPGYFSSKDKQPFCLDCDAGKYQKLGGAKECISCDPGFYNPDKRSTASCKRCIVAGETANDEGTGCIKVNVNPNAAVITIKDLRVASEDGRRVQIIFTLSSGVTATSTIEATDRLELSVSPRTDFKKDTSYILYDLKEIANNNKDPVDFTVIVEPIESNKDDIYDEITGLGSVWEIQRYFRAKIYKKDGESVTFGADSVRNDMWDTATKCGNELYLRTHPDDDLTATPFPLKSLTERGDDTPSCIPCPKGANCRGARTWAQVVSLPGYRPLPWDDRGYGACPRPLACPGTEENYLPAEDTFLLDGGNSTRTAAECYPSHRSMLCSECNHFFDTKLGDQLGLCIACPDATQNYLRLSGLFVVGVLMMSFLVHDTLHGVKKIGELFAFSLLVLLFLCSNSSLVLSSLTTCFVLFCFLFLFLQSPALRREKMQPCRFTRLAFESSPPLCKLLVSSTTFV